MIRFGKRLAKRTIFDYAQCRDENRYTDFMLANLNRQLEERVEELEARDAELAEPKACGAYRIVHEDEYADLKRQANISRAHSAIYHRDMDAKDEEIDRLKSELKSKGEGDASWESRCNRIVNDYNKLFATFINERSANAAKDDEIAKLKRAVDEAKAELRKSKRFYSNEAAYDADAVNGFSDDTTEKLAALAQQVLDRDGKLSFAAACAVVLKRRLDDAKRCNASLAQRYAEEAKNLKEARDYIFKMGQRNWLPDQFLAPWGDASEWTIVNHADGSSSFYKQGQFRDPCANGDNGK